MDAPGGGEGVCAEWDCPGPDFVLADGEEGHDAQSAVSGADEAGCGRLGDAEGV